jgi:hypothetical protein
MSSPEKLEPNDAVLLRYLLGVLPVDEAEPIEEASIVDDDIAARLNAMERDLIDNYIRGEMEGSSLTKFKSWYLSSPLRAQKVEAARAILRIADGVADGVPDDVTTTATHPVAPPHEAESNVETPATSPAIIATEAPKAVSNIAPTLSYGQTSAAQKPIARFGKLNTWQVLGLAAAVVILVVVVGFISTKNNHARSEVAETKQPSPGATAPSDDQHAPASGASVDKSGAQSALAHGTENLGTVTLFLPAPTRGASAIPKVDVPSGTGLVVLSLGLGSTDEDNYRAQLLNPTTQKILWHSGILRPGSDGTYVSVAIPANVLRSQVYLVQLMHDAANGKPELLGTYPLRTEIK